MNYGENYEIMEVNSMVSAVLTESTTKEIFETENISPVKVEKKTERGYVPRGEDNKQPAEIIKKVRESDVMNPNLFFSTLTAYGRGLKTTDASGDDIQNEDIQMFFKRNRPVPFLWEVFTDIKHDFFAVVVFVVSRDGKKIVRLRHKESYHARFESCDPNSGLIENVLFADWDNSPNAEDIESIPVLSTVDPWGDLMIRFGRIPSDDDGKKEVRVKENERTFAYLIKIPSYGKKYYPFPVYQSSFLSGWYDIGASVPKVKNARMKNGMKIRYQVEYHKDYWNTIFDLENITDPEKQAERIKLEKQNIRNFLSGIENQDKVFHSGYYIDPNGKEQRMVRIHVIDTKKDGGDYIEESEESANMLSYAGGVHPLLNGATPGKNKGSLGGSNIREIFTMKQAVEKPVRDLVLEVYQIIADFNDWDLKVSIPDLLLTTLDKGDDAVEVNQYEEPIEEGK